MLTLESAYIIDDEEVICMLLSAILKREGMEIEYSTTIKNAVEGAIEFNPDVIFLDLNLKDGSGFSIVPELQKELPNAEIVIISAHNGESERKQAKNLNIDHFLPKPLNRGLILDSLNQMS